MTKKHGLGGATLPRRFHKDWDAKTEKMKCGKPGKLGFEELTQILRRFEG